MSLLSLSAPPCTEKPNESRDPKPPKKCDGRLTFKTRTRTAGRDLVIRPFIFFGRAGCVSLGFNSSTVLSHFFPYAPEKAAVFETVLLVSNLPPPAANHGFVNVVLRVWAARRQIAVGGRFCFPLAHLSFSAMPSLPTRLRNTVRPQPQSDMHVEIVAIVSRTQLS